MYDVFVDLSSRSVTIAEHAAADMKLSSLHKDMATLFTQACDQAADSGAAGDQQVIKAVARKCMEVIGQLKKLGGDDGVTMEKMPDSMKPSLKRFLFNFAAAEDLV